MVGVAYCWCLHRSALYFKFCNLDSKCRQMVVRFDTHIAFTVGYLAESIARIWTTFAVDTLMTKVLQGTLRLLAQAFFCCRRPVTSVIPLQSVSFSSTFVLVVDNFVFVNILSCIGSFRQQEMHPVCGKSCSSCKHKQPVIWRPRHIRKNIVIVMTLDSVVTDKLRQLACSKQ